MKREDGKIEKKITSGKAHVSVLGLGYVGYPLALAVHEAGFRVTGIDVNVERVFQTRGKNVPFKVTDSYEPLENADVIVVCVPTPVDKYRVPDLSAVKEASEGILKHARRGTLIILESTTYPGTTREFLIQPFEQKGWKPGRDVFIAYCPERIDPGNKSYTIKNTPRVIGGATRKCARAASLFYSQFVRAGIKVLSTPEAAEMTKIFENVFRNVNIALVNELAVLCRKMGVDVWEVIDGASTKPFGFMPFFPGPGVGGHCIPVDPFYLAYRARAFNAEARFIQLAGEINSSMPAYIVERSAEILNGEGLSLKKAKILISGVTYKQDVPDLRHSPALEIMEMLIQRGARVSYLDPYIPEICVRGKKLRALSHTLLKNRKFDLSIIVTPHSNTPFDEILRCSRRVFDTRGVLRNIKSGKIVML